MLFARQHARLVLVALPQHGQHRQPAGGQRHAMRHQLVVSLALFVQEQLARVEHRKWCRDQHHREPAAPGMFDEKVGLDRILAQRAAHHGRVVEAIEHALDLQLPAAHSGPLRNEQCHG
jgi:hypothetical protein